MPLFVLQPPVQYIHRYNGPVIERVLPLSEARKACAARGVHADACACTSNGACHHVIQNNGPVRDRGAYRRHELAHCNGWDHSHSIANDSDPMKAVRWSATLKRRRDSSRECDRHTPRGRSA